MSTDQSAACHFENDSIISQILGLDKEIRELRLRFGLVPGLVHVSGPGD